MSVMLNSTIMNKVKVCGNTRAEDIRVADAAGADIVGVVVEVAVSKRSVSAEAARRLLAAAENAKRAVLLLDPAPERLREITELLDPDIVHLTGEEQPDMLEGLRAYFTGEIFKSIHLPPAAEETEPPVEKAIEMIKTYAVAGADAVVIDTRDVDRGLYGGTGKVSDWNAAAAIVKSSPVPVFLAGGVNIDNAEQAIRTVRPYGLDLASGLEREVGEKDPELVRAFISKVKRLA